MTFSIAARDPQTSWLGFATSSKALAAGAAGEPVKFGTGVIASQAFANPYLAIDGMRLLEGGLPPDQVVERVIASDAGRELRQLGIVDNDGRVAAYTGEHCIDWAGHVLGDGYVCLGNILRGEDVVGGMADAYERAYSEPMYERLMQALEAGEKAGGDRRGRQACGIRVLGEEEYLFCDLRVDDHPEPLQELRRLLELFQRRETQVQETRPRRTDFTPNWAALVRRRDTIERELNDRGDVSTRERAGRTARP